jgi:hypothetical protein
MGQLKKAFEDFLSSEDFDLMFDDEYEQWLKDKQEKEKQLWTKLNNQETQHQSQ